ncbi:MAG: YcxB family protein [Ruminococcaceae bacterium]|nr:YcxB family protein [Oscillospiraceae bacterium]
MLYKFECKTTYKDYYEFNKYHTINSPDVKKSRLIGKLYVPVLFLIMFIYYIIRGDDWYSLSFALVIFSIVSIIWIFSLKPLTLFFLKLHIRFMKKNGKLPYSEFSVMEFYDDSFIEKTDNAKTEAQYNAIFKIRVNEPKAIYIYLNTVLAYIIPLDVFDSNEARDKFLEFIHQKTAK